MFVDASAVVAILKSEPEAHGFMRAIETAMKEKKVFISPIVKFEAVISMAAQRARDAGRDRLNDEDKSLSEELVAALFELIGAREIMITGDIGNGARMASMAYGKLTGHPARLNMGDCFAYAAARAYHTPLLYKGDDFAATDLG
jgi:ribonuclease VapC